MTSLGFEPRLLAFRTSMLPLHHKVNRGLSGIEPKSLGPKPNMLPLQHNPIDGDRI